MFLGIYPLEEVINKVNHLTDRRYIEVRVGQYLPMVCIPLHMHTHTHTHTHHISIAFLYTYIHTYIH